jgi:hypothetical protein
VRSISARSIALPGLALLLLAFVALRVVAAYRVAFNWDELVLFQSVVHSARDGMFRSGGRPGLAQLLLLPWISTCSDEIAAGRLARLLWVGVSTVYLGGVAAFLAEALRGSARRAHDVLLGVALLALVPAFLEWSVQVRTDQLALAGGAWGIAALLASQRKPVLALAAGACFGLGWLASQKLAYLAALGALLAALRLLQSGWQPHRELARAALLGAGASGVWLGFRTLLSSLFELDPSHPARAVLAPSLVQSHLDVFDFYRATIGWSQILAILPTLLAHAALGVGLGVTTVRQLRRGERDLRLLAAWLVLGLGLLVALFHAARFAYFWMTLGLFPAAALALAAEPIRRELAAGAPQRLLLATAGVWLAIGGLVAGQPGGAARQHRLRAPQLRVGLGGLPSRERALLRGDAAARLLVLLHHLSPLRRRAPRERGGALREELPRHAGPLHGRLVPPGPVPARAAPVLGRQLPALSRLGVRRGTPAARRRR